MSEGETKGTRRPIRFAVMVPHPDRLERWKVLVLEELSRMPDVELAMVIVDGRRGEKRPLLTKVREKFPVALWWAYNKYGMSPRSKVPTPTGSLFDGVRMLRCVVRLKGRFSQYFEDVDVATISEENLDFILRFGFGIIRGKILKSARYGVWSYHHHDEHKYRGFPPCFWEIYYGDPVTGVVLQRLTNRHDGGIVLKKASFETVMDRLEDSRDRAYFGSACMPRQVVEDIRLGCADYVEAAPSSTKAPIMRTPRNLQMVRFGLQMVGRRVGNFLKGAGRTS